MQLSVSDYVGLFQVAFNETLEGTVTMFPSKQMNVMNLTGLFVEF